MPLNQKKTGVVLSYVMLISNVLVKFIYTPFLLDKLGQEEYGLYSLVISIIGYLTILDMGFGSAIVRYTIKYKTENNKSKLHRLYGMMSLLYLIIGFIALFICIAIYCNVANLFNESMSASEINKMEIMILLSGVNLLFCFPLQIASSILISYERFIFRNLVNLIKTLLLPVCMVLFITLYDFKSVGLIIIVSIFNLLTYLSFYIYAYKKLDFKLSLRRIDVSLMKSIFTFSSSMFLLMLFEQVQFHSGQFFLGMYYGTKEVAVFGVATIFILNFRSISTSITNVFMPSFVSNVFQQNDETLNSLIFKVSRIQTYVLLLTMLNYIFFGVDFIELWAGEKYKEAYTVSLIVMLPMTVAALLDFGYMIQIAKKELTYRIFTLFSSFLFAFLFVFISAGITLFSYAVIMGVSIIMGQIIFMSIYIVKHLKLDLLKVVFNVIKISIYPICFAVLYFFCIKYSKVIYGLDNGAIGLVIHLLLFNLIIILIYWFLCFSNEEKRMLLKYKVVSK